ncbi:MAG TPA: hypothetical protein VNT52_16675, partial [Acidimicrobiales bacterium]|nr:hypothetical protein [Acidimicrobiales bacterium]
HQARLGEMPELARVITAKFLEYDPVYQNGNRRQRAARRTKEVVGAWGEMLARDVWTDRDRDAAVCESTRLPKLRFFTATTAIAVLFSPLLLLPHGRVVMVATLVALVLPFSPTLARDLRRTRRHRAGATVLTFLASRLPGAGRALLDARCRAADERQAWLCLDAPIELQGFYNGSGFKTVGEPEVIPGRVLIYMERAPEPVEQPARQQIDV